MGNTFKLGNYVNGIFQDASNNIGIGGSPSGSYKLEVTGTAKVSSTLLVSGAATFATDVTIGSPTTNATLSISGDNSGGDSFLNFKADVGAIKGQIQGTKNGANGGIIYFKTLQSSTLTTAMTIKEANVGIGLTPLSSTPLSIKGTYGLWIERGSTNDSGIAMYHDGTNALISSSYQSTGAFGGLALYTSNVQRLLINSAGLLTYSGGGVASIVLGASANYANISSGGYGATLYMNGATRGGTGGATSGCVVLATDAFFAVTDSSTNTFKFTVTSGGNVGIGRTNPSNKLDVINSGAAQGTSLFATDNAIFNSIQVYAAGADGYNGAATVMIMGKNTNNRSINAGGSINASGNDYAEYMTKAIEDNIAKGDVVGVNENGLLTNIFTDAKSFVVKSTDPSYVGGDTWGNVDIIGKLPLEATDEEKAEYQAKIEEARVKVDRIAFSGQVPCNVYDANVGDYIIPIDDNGKIKGQAITNPTFEQYQISVGKVWKIMEDGRAWIAVKIG